MQKLFGFPPSRGRQVSLVVLALAFAWVGVLHFVTPDAFVKIMPPYLPAHLELVLISGFFEIAGGLGLLLARTRTLARWGLLALLVAVFPANVHMALNPELFPDLPVWGLYARLPIQFVLAAWVWYATGRPADTHDQTGWREAWPDQRPNS